MWRDNKTHIRTDGITIVTSTRLLAENERTDANTKSTPASSSLYDEICWWRWCYVVVGCGGNRAGGCCCCHCAEFWVSVCVCIASLSSVYAFCCCVSRAFCRLLLTLPAAKFRKGFFPGTHAQTHTKNALFHTVRHLRELLIRMHVDRAYTHNELDHITHIKHSVCGRENGDHHKLALVSFSYRLLGQAVAPLLSTFCWHDIWLNIHVNPACKSLKTQFYCWDSDHTQPNALKSTQIFEYNTFTSQCCCLTVTVLMKPFDVNKSHYDWDYEHVQDNSRNQMWFVVIANTFILVPFRSNILNLFDFVSVAERFEIF